MTGSEAIRQANTGRETRLGGGPSGTRTLDPRIKSAPESPASEHASAQQTSDMPDRD